MAWIIKRGALFGLLLLIVGGVFAAPDQQQIDNLPSFALALRTDIEQAANDSLGIGIRPPDWTGNIDNTSVNFITDLWYDKELLANVVFGESVRPDQWIGITIERAEIVVRNTRIDLEIIADNIYGGEDIRPPTWSGADRVYRCPRQVQNVFALVRDFYAFSTNIEQDEVGYCVLLEEEMRLFLLEERGLDISGDVLDQAILDARGDLERLANEEYGVNDRPIGWAGNTDIESPLLLTDTYEDLRILADQTIGVNERPDGFVGLITESRVETWRNLRFDLELIATAIVPNYSSIEGTRPRGWQGLTDPMRACTPLTQDLVIVLEDQYGFDEVTPFNRDLFDPEINYCPTLENESNLFAELRPPTATERLAQVNAEGFTYISEYAFAYLDITALEYMGTMPRGTRFRAWYRNFNDSTMMFVSGQNFAVYIDRRWTDMPQDIFDRLPTIEGVAPLTFCDADWCNGPSPTPTPTGGALESVLAVRTPQVEPTVDPSNVLPTDQKATVNFENVRVTYVVDNVQTQTAQVILELCVEPQKITCEPVISILDSATGAPVPIISQQNGQNVYEFPYSFVQNVVIESATLVSTNVFISDPSLPRN
jgi:hypothetical protein